MSSPFLDSMEAEMPMETYDENLEEEEPKDVMVFKNT